MRALMILLLAAPLAAEEITPIPALLKAKKAYDKKFICVTGKTETLHTKVSHNAHPYFTIWLSEGGEKPQGPAWSTYGY